VKIIMALDRRSYAGSPVDIVRKLRSEAVHMKTRDTDAYMRAVVTRLRGEEQADIKIEGESLEERCESFLAGIVRARLTHPVFQREHVDAGAIRVLRRARGITQERLASLLQVAFATVNRWEAGEHLPSSLRSINEELFAYFSRARADEEPGGRLSISTHPTGTLLGARARARESFKPLRRSLDTTIHSKHL